MTRQRLQKLIAAAGLCSRRRAEEWLQAGRVTVDGQVARVGDQADPQQQTIHVDGQPLPSRGVARVLLINKPVGVICSCDDPQGRRTVLDLLPPQHRAGLHPVGRLDADSHGALLLTDLNIYAQVGLVTVIGLAAKNGILIVEVAEQKLEQGLSITEAAVQSAESRLRPILMTAIAALAGFLPLVLANGAGAHSQQSLGTVIFGGLVVATVLSLGVVPPVYVLVKNLELHLFKPIS
ncbi:pseudouridine synthase [Synechococcus sp. TAK9802]|nr:efflux RND transporter permease subunit [Synechococcus sp. TAK9802]QNI61114.1 pseudouridine synthase [Synechococcus sp. TAK9802]